MNSICKVAALKVERKQGYLLKIRKFNAYKNDSNGTTTRYLPGFIRN